MRRSIRAPCLLSFLLGVHLALGAACRPASTLPMLGPAPEFTLVDQQGSPFSSADLAGKVVVADFVFTNCTDACPLLSATMSRIRDRLRDARLLDGKAVLVSFSVDPEHDTPQVLAGYAAHFGADPANWRFLTGDRAEMEDLMVAGFHLGAPTLGPPSGGGRAEIVHTTRFVVIDPRAQIRWYPRGDEVDVEQVVDEVRRLAS
ncbi:MAG TPA: SCO family protein [Chloroflexota bacterium]|nr:SCO family protein [Chloroflexota bacterium]